MEQSMDLAYIYDTFDGLETVHDKVEYLKDLKRLDLGYDINYDKLIEVWSAMAQVETEN
jgi:hypothetical protein